MPRLRRSLLFFSLSFVLLWSTASAASPPKPKPARKYSAPRVTGKIMQPSPFPGPGGGGPPVITLEGGWQLVDVPAGTSVTAQDIGSPPVATSADQHVYVLNGPDGVLSSPLPDTIKNELVPPDDGGPIVFNPDDDGTAVYAVSEEIAEGIDASEAAGELTPEIAAIAEPLDEDMESSASIGTNSIFGGSCSPKPESYSRSFNISDKTYTKNFTLSGGFSGSFTATGHISGAVNADVAFEVKRKNVIGFCVPYGVRFKTLHAYGNATSTGGIDLTGTLNYAGTFGPWDIAKPTLFEFTVSVYGIPVKIGFNLPITSGLSVTATATGTVNYNGTHVATGTFDYTCTLDNCTGTHTFENTPDSSDQEFTGGLSGHIKPVPYVDVGVRAYLYDDSIAYAQLGVRPYLLGDLWGYDGNACGDADGDAVNETVHALTFDLDRRIDFTGKAGILGSDVWDRTLRTGTVKHVGFYSLGNSTAMQPQLQGPGVLAPGAAGQYKVKVRPCWPYTDLMTYQVNWGDGGAAQTLQGAPGTDVTTSHTWTAAGSPTATATTVSDAHGRALGQTYSRTIQVQPPSATVTPSPGSATSGAPITWTVTATGFDPATLKYALFRRRAGTSPWTPDVTTPAWQASNVLTWTPASTDTGVWEIYVWVKDGTTAATANTYGYTTGLNPGPVQVVAPLAVSCPSTPAVAVYGTALNWTVSSTGGTPGTVQYTLGRQLAGTATWLPSPLVWQSGSTLSWTPTSADVGTWTVAVGARDVNTAPNANGLGYSSACTIGTVQIVPPLSLSVSPSPASSVYGNAITWTATAHGGDSSTYKYAFFRRRAGAATWTPDVTAAVWQSSNVFTWTPTLSDSGGQPWEIILWVKDGTTAANANTYGYAAYVNAGPVQVVTPPITLTTTGSPASSTAGTPITWTATASGGNPSTYQYAFFRRRAGAPTWTPDITAPVWQTSNVFSWTPTSADADTWEIILWVKDVDTPANANGYGYAAYHNAGPVQVVAPLTVTCTPSPATSTYGNAITWAPTANGGVPGTIQYALTRQLIGTNVWLPSTLVWQSGNALSWTPGAGDVGTWQVSILVKDSGTPANPGYTAYCGAGQVKVTAPLTLTGTGSPASSPSGTSISWTANASGGDAATLKYAYFRRRAGDTAWTPDITAPVWQTGNVFNWTPAAADAGAWDIIIWVKDASTPATANGYGFAAYYNAGAVQVYNPITLTGTGSPGSANYGNTLTWTANAGGGTPGTFQYAFFRRRAGTTPWTPDLTAPAWQSSNVMSWTPTSSDTGTWDTYVWVKDANTPAGMNTYTYGAGYNPGQVQITAPPAPVTLNTTGSPASVQLGTTITWTATASGGDPSTYSYALFRRRAGASAWTPDITAPVWQTSNVLSWTPAAGDADTWEIIIWVKDGNTPANMNTYGYAAYHNALPVQVIAQAYPAKGWIDGFNSQHVWGWACDPDYPTQDNRVDFWTTSGQPLGSSGAYMTSNAGVTSACLGGTAHNFDWYPSGGIPSGTHFNAWSIDLPYSTPGNDNRKMGGTGSIGDGTEFVIP